MSEAEGRMLEVDLKVTWAKSSSYAKASEDEKGGSRSREQWTMLRKISRRILQPIFI